jgi:hypothetical protein
MLRAGGGDGGNNGVEDRDTGGVGEAPPGNFRLLEILFFRRDATTTLGRTAQDSDGRFEFRLRLRASASASRFQAPRSRYSLNLDRCLDGRGLFRSTLKITLLPAATRDR